MIRHKKVRNIAGPFRIPVIMLLLMFLAVAAIHAQDQNAAINSQFGDDNDDENITFQELLSELAGFGVGAFDRVAVMTALMGNNWSDPYIGPIVSSTPHYGIGLTLGSSFRPSRAIGSDENSEDLLALLNFNDIEDISEDGGGVYFLPGYSLDVRIGGPDTIPLDFGIKFGYIGLSVAEENGVANANYLLFGVDTRYQLVKPDSVFIPEISAGAGYNYLHYGLDFVGSNNLMADSDSKAELSEAGYNYGKAYPQTWINLNTHVVELMVQGGWNLLGFIEPYLGISTYFSNTSLTTGAGIDFGVTDQKAKIEQKNSVGKILGVRAFGGLGFSSGWFTSQLGMSYQPEYSVTNISLGFRAQF